jgi:hypothetical protein
LTDITAVFRTGYLPGVRQRAGEAIQSVADFIVDWRLQTEALIQSIGEYSQTSGRIVAYPDITHLRVLCGLPVMHSESALCQNS